MLRTLSFQLSPEAWPNLDTPPTRRYKPRTLDREATVVSRAEHHVAGPADDDAKDAALRARLDTLSKSLDANKEPASERSPVDDTSLGGAMSLGFRVLTEFVAGVGVGSLIGWQLDKWLHTSPALLIVFLTLGTGAGFWNVYRIAVKPTTRGPGPH